MSILFKTDHLLGKKFVFGKQDCFATARQFYGDNFDLWVTDYARPENFWKFDYQLIMDNFYTEGFRTITEHPKDWKPGDAIIMAIKSDIPNHVAVLMEDGNILHHPWGGLSCIESYNRPIYRDRTLAIMRHPLVTERMPVMDAPKQDLMELLPDVVRRKLAKALSDAGTGESWVPAQDR